MTNTQGAPNKANEYLPVVAGVLVDALGRCLMAQRPAGKVYAGYWEFPGGKVEAGESLVQALERELREELAVAIDLSQTALWQTTHFQYPHAYVQLNIFLCFAWVGKPCPQEGQVLMWQENFEVTPILPATLGLLPALSHTIAKAIGGRRAS